MERITLFIRTSKEEGQIKLRFRLRDTESVQLYHKSGIKADLKDLAKFEVDGSVKARVKVYNQELKAAIETRMAVMSQAYQNLCKTLAMSHITGELFEKEIARLLGQGGIVAMAAKETLLDRFGRFIEEGYRDNMFNEKRMKNYLFVKDSMERFLIIKGLEKISADELTADMLMDLRAFFADEYKYVTNRRWAHLFKNITNKRYLPTERREENTVIGRMKKLNAFYNELRDKEEVEISPFQRLGRKRKTQVMTERYDEPHFLRKEELLKIMATEVPETLAQTKDAFLLQCAFGCRISDFRLMTMEKISVTEDGIPYIHYLPQKTLRENTRKEEIETPILPFALDIIKKWQFQMRIINYPGGENGYNARIRRLLEHCGIDRPVKTYDAEKKDNVFRPLYEYGCSKLCRSTHVDMMSKLALDPYMAQLHSRGSKAVNHYTKAELRDRYAMMCIAFNQPMQKVDKDLNVIED